MFAVKMPSGAALTVWYLKSSFDGVDDQVEGGPGSKPRSFEWSCFPLSAAL